MRITLRVISNNVCHFSSIQTVIGKMNKCGIIKLNKTKQNWNWYCPNKNKFHHSIFKWSKYWILIICLISHNFTFILIINFTTLFINILNINKLQKLSLILANWIHCGAIGLKIISSYRFNCFITEIHITVMKEFKG